VCLVLQEWQGEQIWLLLIPRDWRSDCKCRLLQGFIQARIAKLGIRVLLLPDLDKALMQQMFGATVMRSSAATRHSQTKEIKTLSGFWAHFCCNLCLIAKELKTGLHQLARRLNKKQPLQNTHTV
jgi:hypothetical protein